MQNYTPRCRYVTGVQSVERAPNAGLVSASDASAIKDANRRYAMISRGRERYLPANWPL